MQPAENIQAHPALVFNPPADMAVAHHDARFAHTLQVYHDEWFGIASASAALPGHKLRIRQELMDGDAARHILAYLDAQAISTVCFQGFSAVADELVTTLSQHAAGAVRLYAVSHVTSTQFQAPFEVRMQAALRRHHQAGCIKRLGSVKPHFSDVVPETWAATLVNFCPRLEAAPAAESGRVFIPVENHWRKGLYTNLIAALRVGAVKAVQCVHEPKHLGLLEDLSRVEVSGLLSREQMHHAIARAVVTMNVSLAECQPMTQLEAFALARPCLTGPLGLEEFASDPLTELCTVAQTDTPHGIMERLTHVFDLQAADPAAVPQMTADHIALRHRVAADRYGDFLDL